MSAYDKLDRTVQKWIRDRGWKELRPIQVEGIEAFFGSKSDIVIAASTASGKTEAAFLPAVSEAISTVSSSRRGFSILYIGPLKALITDQAQRLQEMCRESELLIVPWHGDVSASVKSRAMKAPSGVLLITPESLEALFVRRGLELSRIFDSLSAIVIDELHAFLDTERGVQVRSLLARLEVLLGRKIRKIGLSATLGDMSLAKAFLHPEAPNEVQLIEDESSASELRIQLRGYVHDPNDNSKPAPLANISDHVFEHLRGSNNLIFGGNRQSVELYADRLRQLCEDAKLPNEFFPHHASLSKSHRQDVEERLKAGRLPTTAICTSTLELGIDIGDVKCVAQIGAPFSVASLRQRLGRSGRREGVPAILRQYAIEQRLDSDCSFADRLRIRLVRAVAMIELLLENWCEPPRSEALHLSTLVHQILSVIAQKGGAKAGDLFEVLCTKGAFSNISQPIFAAVLRSIGRPKINLVEQASDGLLLLGREGERLVEHYSFYAVFQTPEEFRLVANGKELGTIPIDNTVSPGTLLIFSGRRWIVKEVHDRERVIMVAPAKGGKPPLFGGDPGDIHDKIVDRMFELYENEHNPIYLDNAAISMLEEARREYETYGFSQQSICKLGENAGIIATRAGTVATTTLALAMRSVGARTEQHDGFLEITVEDGFEAVEIFLEDLSNGDTPNLFANNPTLHFEKFHPYLNDELLKFDALSTRLQENRLSEICAEIIQ